MARDTCAEQQARPAELRRASLWHAVLWCTAGAVLSLLAATWVLQLWRADLSVPLNYGGDATFYQMVVKGIAENGWYLRNPSLGAPYVQELIDFPMSETLQFATLRLGTLFTRDVGLLINLYFLLGFPAIVVAFMMAARRLRISYMSGMVGGLLFAFLPYHLFRGEAHLSLSSYFVLPLFLPVISWILGRPPLFFRTATDSGAPMRFAFAGREVWAVVTCLLAAVSTIYYPLFGSFFLLLAGLIGTWRRRDIRPALAAAALAALIFVALVVNLSPSIAYQLANGRNTSVGTRSAFESELYPVKITQLLLPVTGHRIAALARLKATYNTFPEVNENDFATLGLVGGLSFLFLLLAKSVGATKIRWLEAREAALIDALGTMTFWGLLLGLMGGFGALFAFLVSPQLRGWNRISVFLGLFAFMGLSVLLDRLAIGLRQRGIAGIVWVVAAAVVVLGVYDTASVNAVPDYTGNAARWQADRSFATSIQAALPRGSSVYELPYAPFPEGDPVPKMPAYELLRGYLHSSTLRWSFGSMNGREGDAWQRRAAAMPTDGLVSLLRATGFRGIVLDRRGYEDRGARLEADLTRSLGPPRFVSREGDRSFFMVPSGPAGTSAADVGRLRQ